MARTHHGASAYRLSCGCLTVLPSVADTAFTEDMLLCAACYSASFVTFRYPSGRRSCAAATVAARPGGGVTRVRCCLRPGHGGCRHFDASAGLWYELPGRLAASRSGKA